MILMTFDQVMENLTIDEQRIIEQEIEDRVQAADDFSYGMGWENGFAAGLDD